jgi:hypothetical protein
MSVYQPFEVNKLADVVGSITKALELDGALPDEERQALALRLMELYDSGITDPNRLLLEIMADSMWASERREVG